MFSKSTKFLQDGDELEGVQSNPLIRAQSGNQKVALISGSLFYANYMQNSAKNDSCQHLLNSTPTPINLML
jgi:hypothetical protein